MNDIDRLCESMDGQKELYESLLELSAALGRLIDEGAETAAMLPLLAGREGVIERLKEGDSAISAILNAPGAAALLEDGRAAKLRETMVELVKKAMAADRACMEKLEKIRDQVAAQMRTMRNGKKTITGYGRVGKPVYAKFIDLKS